MDQINELLQTYKYPLLIALVGGVLVLSGSMSSVLQSSAAETKELPKESFVDKTANMIKVDIAGAVNRPGVYELQKDTRVDDLLKEAGGFTTDANPEYVSKNLNLSQKISDGEKIYVPFKGENPIYGAVSGAASSNSEITGKMDGTSQPISINTASQSELEELPGIGPSTSSKIIAGRPYESLNDLLTKKAVGKATFEKIKKLIEL